MISRWSLIALVALAATGCTSPLELQPAETDPAVPAPVIGDGERWWRIRFRIAWPVDAEPSWHVDALLADQVVAPMLHELAPRVALWRFHRRAGRSPAGHQLSFLFYTDVASAEMALARLETSSVLSALVERGVVEQVLPPDADGAALPTLESTSDHNWPIEIQRSWPWYIMGVSQHWMRLIREVRKTLSPPARSDITALLDH